MNYMKRCDILFGNIVWTYMEREKMITGLSIAKNITEITAIQSLSHTGNGFSFECIDMVGAYNFTLREAGNSPG